MQDTKQNISSNMITEQNLSDIFEQWNNNQSLLGVKIPTEPSMVGFHNTVSACELLHKHLEDPYSRVVIHCDVDIDGLGSGNILYKFIKAMYPLKHSSRMINLCINKEREHGIRDGYAKLTQQTPIGLFIILDSSSSELDIIRQFHCDVLVIDHHEIDHDTYRGKTESGHDFILVNNLIAPGDSEHDDINNWLSPENPNSDAISKYEVTDKMSCGLVVYELLRVFEQKYFPASDVNLKTLMLYQWVGVTLFTDAIILQTPRNIYYIYNTTHSREIEPWLKASIDCLSNSRFNPYLDKSFINYSLAPTINRAMRAHKLCEALNCVTSDVLILKDFKQYQELQNSILDKALSIVEEHENYCLVDITNIAPASFAGVTAGRVSDKYRKPCLVYTTSSGFIKGSFRAANATTEHDYRLDFVNSSSLIHAAGHKQAFGFSIDSPSISYNILDSIFSASSKAIQSDELSNTFRYYLTAGDKLPESLRGKHHISNSMIEAFRKSSGFMKLGMGNSMLSSREIIDIVVDSKEPELIAQTGKLYKYCLFGIECKAFQKIDTFTNPVARLYVELSGSLEFYIKQS